MKGCMIIKNASQLVTCSGFKARRGKAMSDLCIIDDGAVVIENGVITAVGKTGEVLAKFDETGFETIDVTERRFYQDLSILIPILFSQDTGMKSFPGG